MAEGGLGRDKGPRPTKGAPSLSPAVARRLSPPLKRRGVMGSGLSCFYLGGGSHDEHEG
jgi:hypothetical protein